jgi:4-amino-4-deoxy-L-arabinose transferase-like glycosyltransferase
MATRADAPERAVPRAASDGALARAAVLLVVAAIPRFAWLATPPCALDESWSWYHVGLMLQAHDYWKPLGIAIDGPLFVAINLGMAKLLGHDGIWPMRIPAAVFGTLAVPLFYLLVRRLADARLAWRAALLMSVSPFFVYYAKEARPYAQMLFASMLFLWAFFATETWPTRRRRLLLALLTDVAVASHYYAVVFFAGFWLQRLWGHRRAGRRDALRADFWTAALCAVATLPLAFVFLASFTRIPFGYWASPAVNVVTIVAEQFLFTGTLGLGDDPNVLLTFVVQAGVFLLLLLPWIVVRVRRAPRPALHPVLNALWLWPPATMQVFDLVTGGHAMFLPRGFIGSAPFLLTWWLAWCDAMPTRTAVRRGYQALLLAPVLLAGLWVGTSDPKHAAFKNREVIQEIVDQMRPYEGRFGVVAAHFWWMAQYYAYFYRGAATVVPLGLFDRDAAYAAHSEMAGVRAGLARLPRDQGVMLIENAVADRWLDPHHEVATTLAAQRPTLAEIRCHPRLGPEVALFCTRIVLFGPVAQGR